MAAVDGLAFVDLPPGSLRSGGQVVDRTVRVFGFDRRYRQHHPSIRVVSGAFAGGRRPAQRRGGAEAGARAGDPAPRPGASRAAVLPVSGVADLSRATPLFSSRKSNKLEAFLYVPDALVVGPATFQRAIVPAFRAAGAARGTALKSLPLLEADVLVDRSRLRADPAGAFAQTRAIARAIRRAAPDRPEVIDNISNTLQVARDDATVGKRMFLFLGLPGALLAAVLAAYTASVLAGTQRREQANLRLRGADRGHLLRMLGYRTVAFASVGAVAGTAVGLLSVLAILGGGSLFEASAGALLASALASVGFGMAITALALYVPARRGLRHDISEERREISLAPAPAWRRLRLDVVLLAAAVVAEGLALHRGAFDAPAARCPRAGRCRCRPISCSRRWSRGSAASCWPSGSSRPGRRGSRSRRPRGSVRWSAGRSGATSGGASWTLAAGRRRGAGDRLRHGPCDLHLDLRRREGGRRAVHRGLRHSRHPERAELPAASARLRVRPARARRRRGDARRLRGGELRPDRPVQRGPEEPGGHRAGDVRAGGAALGCRLRRGVGRGRARRAAATPAACSCRSSPPTTSRWTPATRSGAARPRHEAPAAEGFHVRDLPAPGVPPGRGPRHEAAAHTTRRPGPGRRGLLPGAAAERGAAGSHARRTGCESGKAVASTSTRLETARQGPVEPDGPQRPRARRPRLALHAADERPASRSSSSV